MSSTRKRCAALVLALLMALGLVATAAPVSADNVFDGGVVLFRGRAKIGSQHTNACIPQASPTGLNFPWIANDNWPGTQKCYKFVAPGPKFNGSVAPIAAFCWSAGLVNGGLRLPTDFPDDNCSISANGVLKGFIFDQPHCGISASNGGKGEAKVDPGTPAEKTVALSNLGWITSAGSILPVTGNWDSGDPGKDKGPRKLVALVQAGGNTKADEGLLPACSSPKGATTFDVTAVAVLTPVFGILDKCNELNLLKHPKKDSCW